MKIGIIGCAGAGKDTVANIICKLHPKFSVARFAEPLKYAARRAFGDRFDDRDVKEVRIPVTEDLADALLLAAYDMCNRKLQFSDEELDKAGELYAEIERFYVGSEISPREYQQILGTEVVRKVRDTAFVDAVACCAGDIVVPDVRFSNEANVFDLLLYVYRPDSPRVANHASEQLARNIAEEIEEFSAQTFARLPSSAWVPGTDPVYKAEGFEVKRLSSNREAVVIYNTDSFEFLEKQVGQEVFGL
jgi:hypothetical protein